MMVYPYNGNLIHGKMVFKLSLVLIHSSIDGNKVKKKFL